MIIRVYSKYIEVAGGQKDGKSFDSAYRGTIEKKKEWTVLRIFGKIMAKSLLQIKRVTATIA